MRESEHYLYYAKVYEMYFMCPSYLRLQREEMRYALDLLHDCTSARVSEWAHHTKAEGHQLFTPALQLRCSAVEATAKLLKGLLPGELNYQSWSWKYFKYIHHGQ